MNDRDDELHMHEDGDHDALQEEEEDTNREAPLQVEVTTTAAAARSSTERIQGRARSAPSHNDRQSLLRQLALGSPPSMPVSVRDVENESMQPLLEEERWAEAEEATVTNEQQHNAAPRVTARSSSSSPTVVVNNPENQAGDNVHNRPFNAIRSTLFAPPQNRENHLMNDFDANFYDSFSRNHRAFPAPAPVPSTTTNHTYGWSMVEHRSTTTAAPSGRSLHAAAVLGDSLYVFGGYNGMARVNSFHAFHFPSGTWSLIVPRNDAANPATPQLPNAGIVPANPPRIPSPRDRHLAFTYGNCFYIHGGFDGRSRVDDFWYFDFDTWSWHEIVPQTAAGGRPPSPRHSHCAVVYQHKAFFFGGYDGSYKSDLHEYDFVLQRWQAVVQTTGRRPRPRYRATCVVYQQSMILFGGHDGTRHLHDTHLYHFETRAWSALTTSSSPPPAPRDSHVSVMHGQAMYVFGGSSGTALNDLHELQFVTTTNSTTDLATTEVAQWDGSHHGNLRARWRLVHAATAAGTAEDTVVGPAFVPRQRFCHVGVVYESSLYVFGGYDGSERLHDFCQFDLAHLDSTLGGANGLLVPPSTILADFRSLINNPALSDVSFLLGPHRVYAHKLVLCIRCPYFQALFSRQENHWREAQEDTVRIEQVRYEIFLLVMEYLYTDSVALPPVVPTATSSLPADAMELFEAADLFGLERLKSMCELRMLNSMTMDNCATIFLAADMHSALHLRQKCKHYMLAHFEQVSKSAAFEEMGRSNIELVFELLHSR
jgi:leucine-zipper-like transcriptional regulator 1